MGENEGAITASYATGNPDGGTGNSDQVGGLVGRYSSGTITESYAFGSRLDGTFTDSRGTPPVTSTYGLTLANAGTSWNNATGGTAGAWNFGTTSQNPALVYADYDGTGGTDYCGMYPAKIPGTDIDLECGRY